VYLASYGHQEQDKELISAQNHLVPFDWRQYTRQRVTTLEVAPGSSVGLSETRVAITGRNVLAWHWYDVNGKPSHTRLRTKLNEALEALDPVGVVSSVRMVAVSSDGDDFDAMRSLLESQVRTLWPLLARGAPPQRPGVRMAAHSQPAVPLIAHVVFRFDYGGLENGLVNLVNRLPVDRFRHAIVALDGMGEDFRRRLHRPDVPVLSIGKRPGKDPPSYYRMWRTLRRLQPDIVHTRNLGTLDMQLAAAAAGVRRRVHGEHGWSPSDPQGLDPRNLRLRRLLRSLPQGYVAMSRDIARWLEQSIGVPAERIRQLYSGVDTGRFGPEGPVPADLPWPRDPGADAAAGHRGLGRPLRSHQEPRRPAARVPCNP
jgi:EpsI family protein